MILLLWIYPYLIHNLYPIWIKKPICSFDFMTYFCTLIMSLEIKIMKKLFVTIAIIIGLIGVSTSCDFASTPESVAKRDAKEYVRAMKSGDGVRMYNAEKKEQKHLDKYFMHDNKNGTDYCDRYTHAFSDYVDEYLKEAYE